MPMKSKHFSIYIPFGIAFLISAAVVGDYFKHPLPLLILFNLGCFFLLIPFLSYWHRKQLPKDELPFAPESEDKKTISIAQTIVHDLKEPLRSIQTYSTLLQLEKAVNEKEHQEFLDEIINNSTRLQSFLNRFLEFSSSLEYRKESVKNQLLEDALMVAKNNLFGLINLRNAQISVETHGLTMYEFAFIDFVRIFQNLLSNAIKYCPDYRTPCVQITISDLGTCIRIKVKDNGIGLDPSTQPSLTQPFFRHDSANHVKGTGLGLAIVHNLVLKYKGKLQYYNHSEKGAIFEIFLPKIEDFELVIPSEEQKEKLL